MASLLQASRFTSQGRVTGSWFRNILFFGVKHPLCLRNSPNLSSNHSGGSGMLYRSIAILSQRISQHSRLRFVDFRALGRLRIQEL